MAVIAANIIDLVAALIQVVSGSIQKKAKILVVQILQLLMQATSMFLLGGIPGGISNVLSCLRNYLCYKEKLSTLWKIALTVVSLVMTVLFNEQGVLGYLPVAVCTVYMILMDTKDPIQFKLLVTVSFLPWMVYHFVLGSYVGAIFDAATVVSNAVTLGVMIREKKKSP